jgi:hypothetical protein
MIILNEVLRPASDGRRAPASRCVNETFDQPLAVGFDPGLLETFRGRES